MAGRYERVPMAAPEDASEQAADSTTYAAPSSREVENPATTSASRFNFLSLFTMQGLRSLFQSLTQDDPSETPAASVRRFVEHLRQHYSLGPLSSNLPSFSYSALDECFAQSNRELKPLLVYLHSDLHESADDFVRLTLCNPEFSAYLNRNFLLWAGSVHRPDGFTAATKLNAGAFPFIGVYAPTAESTATRPKFQLVWAHEDGFISASELRLSLETHCNSALTTLETIRMDRQAQLNERQLREEQERDFRESEERDRQRMREKQEMIQKAAAEKARLEEEQELAAAIALSKELHKESILNAAQRRLEGHPEPATTTDSTLIRFTLPSGVKIQRRFALADTLQIVQDYVVVATSELGTPLHHFDMATNYPKRLFSATSDNTATLKSLGLPAQLMLFVSQTAEQVEQDLADAKAESEAT